jgi:hypothetical protein
MRKLKDQFKAIIFITLITVVVVEIALRLSNDLLVLPSPYQPDGTLFWAYSAELGWDLVPGSRGIYTNGFFKGKISIDERGIRRNSEQGTYIEGYANVLFVGDSTTASFEVDDHETVPAVLERLLRENGFKVNVLNLGARAYGADQSVLKAIKYAKDFYPVQVVYMYTDNDVYDNNNLQKRGRTFGKGSFIRRHPDERFVAHDYPVPKRPIGYAGLIVFDDNCNPVIYEEQIPPATDAPAPANIKILAREYSYSARALHFLKHEIETSLNHRSEKQADLHEFLIQKGNKLIDLSLEDINNLEIGYRDNGLLRRRCSQYFDDQMAFLLEKLKRFDKVRHIHVVQFPGLKQSATEDSPISRLFNRLALKSVIDSHTDLHKIAIDGHIVSGKYECKGDGHYCAEGNKWIATEIYRALTSGHFLER